jgi:Ran-binding protein 3
MRADATHRLLLNAPLFHEFSIAVSNEKYVRFTVIEGGNPISYMLRVSSSLPRVRPVRADESPRRAQTGNPTLAESLVQAVRDKVATL